MSSALRVPSTRDRITRITFDDTLPLVNQPLFVFMKLAKEMAKGPCPDRQNVVLINGGWELEAHQYNFGNSLLSAIASSWHTPITADTFSAKNSQRQTGLLGVSYSGSVLAAGVPLYQKRIPQGTSFLQKLAADQTAFSSPATSEDLSDMDRVAITSAAHHPEEAVFFVFRLTHGPNHGFGPAITLFVNGPVGSDCHDTGTGLMALKIYDDGRGKLYERVTPNAGGAQFWKFRTAMTLFTSLSTGFEICTLVIGNNLRKLPSGKYVGNKMTFSTSSVHRPGFLLIESLIGVAISAIEQSAGINPRTYTAPQLLKTAAITEAPIRLDVRRDARPQWGLGKLVYQTTGYIVDDPFTLPFHPNTSKDFTIEYYAKIPTGTTLVVRMFDATDDTELTPVTTFVDDLGGIYTFTPHDRIRRYYVRFDFTSSGTATPRLESYRVFRDPVVETPTLTTTVFPQRDNPLYLPKADVTNINIKGTTGDPRSDAASFVIEDYFNKNPFLRSCAHRAIKIETAYDPVPNYTTLFRGYTRHVRGSRKGKNKNKTYPDREYTSYTVDCIGEWRRLTELRTPKRYLFWDKAVDSPMKVSDIIYILLSGLGYQSSQLDIPDIDIRLFSSSEDDYIVEPGSNVAEFIVSLAADYLGAFIIWDEGAGTTGMWRLVQPSAAPYNNLAIFEEEIPTALTLPHISDAYGTDTGTGAYAGQIIKKTFMKSGTVEDWAEEMEGNMVVVHGLAGSADAASKAGSTDSVQLTSIAVNVNSFNFLGLAPAAAGYPSVTGVDYIGRCVPIDVYDASLTTQQACDWVCRRIFDYACHNRQYKSFIAPLILVQDQFDTKAFNPRKLRFGDPVQVRQRDGSLKQFLVANCNPMYTRDGFQFAHYELVSASNIDTYGTPYNRDYLKDALLGVVNQNQGKNPRSKQHMTKQRYYSNKVADWARLPENNAKELQVLDPADPDFGKFYFMQDYDPLA